MMSTRRLAAILAADVVGYSRLVGADEAGTLERLRTLRREVVEPLVSENGGRVFKTTGDGLLAEFRSTVQALRCAIGMQERLRGGELQGQLQVRIGVHQGDVAVDGDDLLGDGVNVAARLEALAEPGGICISGRVREDAAGKLALEVDDLGEPELKNIAQRHRVFRVRLDQPERPPLPLPDKPSIAVLPFLNMSGDPEQEYFADGMVEEIITGLSRVRSFFVISRNSSFSYKDKSPDARQVSRELGVRYVLEGSVRKAGTRVRITGQLIEATSGAHLWADRFDGALDDIFDLQDRITSAVVSAIEPVVRSAEIERAQRKPTESLQAYDLALRALPHMHSYNRERVAEAARLLRRATEIDPSFAVSFARLALCLYVPLPQGWAPATKERFDEIEFLVRIALERSDSDPEVLAWSAWLLGCSVRGDLDGALDLAKRAVALNPSSTIALSASGYLHAHAGNVQEAIEHLERAARLNPLEDGFYRHHVTAIAYFLAGEFEHSVQSAERALASRPTLVPPLRYLAVSLVLLGRVKEAREAGDRLRAIVPELTVSRTRAFFELDTPLKSKMWTMLDAYCDALRRAGIPE
jgi:adenylate cyclase